MAFLFGKKKPSGHGGAQGPRDVQPPGGLASSIPTANGVREREKTSGSTQNTTPGSSINNSINSLGGAATPSPEHGTGARGQEPESQSGTRPPMNGSAPTNGAPNAQLYPWSQRRLTFTTSQPNPFPRYGAAVNATSSKEGEIYLMGGLVNGSTVKADLWMIEAGGGNLACYPIGTTSEGPGPRVGHASLLVGNAFIVFGGDTKQDERDSLDDTLYLLNTSTRQWSRAVPPGPRPAGRYGHTLNILGSKIFIFGGQVEGHFFNDLVAFDLNALQNPNNRWDLLILDSVHGGPPDGQIPPGRTNHTIVSWNDKLYLFGGTDGTHWFNDVWAYDPRANSWSQLDCIGFIPVPREGHSAALVGDVMYIFGGRSEEGTDLGDLAAFRITSRRWYTFQNMGTSPSPRSGHSMTAFNKQIVVLAGEPSSAPMDPGELSLVYVLDTSKIRYPVDQQIQQTPVGERVPGNRRPSTERSALPQSKGMLAREPSSGPPDGPKRMFSGSRESIAGGPGTILRGQENGVANPPPSTTQGSRLPRAAGAQAPVGPPSQQAPPPRMNGIPPMTIGPRSQTPTKDNRTYGPPVDTSRAASFDRQEVQSTVHDAPHGLSNQAMSPSNRPMGPTTNGIVGPMTNGRATPTQQTIRPVNIQHQEEMSSSLNDTPISPPRQDLQSPSIEERVAAQHSSPAQKRSAPTAYDTLEDRSMSRNGAVRGQDLLQEQLESMGKELETIKSRNAWYASELALARKAGYRQGGSPSPTLDERGGQSFGDDDKPLVEALIAMKTELVDVQNSVESRVLEASQKVVDAEQQRDTAIREAVYAKAKLAAHGGSQAGTPQLEDTSRNLTETDRSMDMSHKLSTALTQQATYRSQIDALIAELESEKRVRDLAESSADAAHKRANELDQDRNPGEIDGLRAELYEAERTARDEAASKAEAHARARVLEVDLEDMKGQLEEAVSNSDAHFTTLGSLREAVAASHGKSSLLMRQLDEERTQREELQHKLVQLRSEHEERTSELETTTKKLHDTEELADKHANEAEMHRATVMSGLEKLSLRSPNGHKNALHDKRIAILQEQLHSANELVRKNQVDADNATEKLRRAEERIAGLETYQEQASRESLGVRKQLQEAVRGAQILQAQHNDVRKQLESHQRDTSALVVQHSALKQLLDERPSSASGQGRSRNLDVAGGRLGTPDRDQVRDLEQQLAESRRVLEDTKVAHDTRAEEVDRAFREKIDQLEQDYQSAVHYVKGTEKMLKRMKDELTKYKGLTSHLQSELEGSQRINADRSLDREAPADWENERQQLRREIEEMQDSVKGSVSHLEHEIQEVHSELRRVEEERDHFHTKSEETQNRLTVATEKARTDLEQLRNENAKLESRAMDAEDKVSMLLDQVESSVDKYRRQSQQIPSDGFSHTRNTSSNSFTLGGHSHNTSIGADSAFSATAPDNRNSIALDSLATELETLKTQWEGTHRTYRLSSQFDFERTPTTATGGELSHSLANWRKRLDEDERNKDNSRSPPLQSPTSPLGVITNGRVASPRGIEIERDRLRGGMTSPLRRHEGEPTPMNVM